jgi:hypothetical protein
VAGCLPLAWHWALWKPNDSVCYIRRCRYVAAVSAVVFVLVGTFS